MLSHAFACFDQVNESAETKRVRNWVKQLKAETRSGVGGWMSFNQRKQIGSKIWKHLMKSFYYGE